MRRMVIGLAACTFATSVLSAATPGVLPSPIPAQADAAAVKAGVDAWGQGDYGKAVALWRPAAEAGDADAQFNLGQAYKTGRGVPVDETIALEWFRRAAVQGHARAEDNYGRLLFQTGKRTEAMPFIEKSAARGDPRAQYLLGTALFNGEYGAKDWVRAYALMSRAAASGLMPATTSLAQMDRYIPADQRQQGLALAQTMASQQQAAALAAAVLPSAPASPPALAPRPAPPRTAPPPVIRPTTSPSPKAAPSQPSAGNWRVQLGAFSDEGRADALWTGLRKKVTALSGKQRYLVKAGGLTRLQAGPLASRAEADALCASIRAAGTDCIAKPL
ncbi:MAG: hypothetical protein DI547_02700 [Sphingobium sp.]|nr:MAG: hypothetical protein DI547_02700 [Sphingobium sp.]